MCPEFKWAGLNGIFEMAFLKGERALPLGFQVLGEA
jgi:hypothetical protein